MLAALSILAEGGATKEVINPVLPTGNEMIWGAIAFFALLVLMNWVLLPPLKQAMRKREEQLRSDAEAAEHAALEGEGVRRDYDTTLAEARRQAAAIIDDARQAGEARRAEVIRAAEDEVAALRQSAIAELDGERASALDQMKGDLATIAVAAAGKVVQKDLDVSANRSVVDAHVGSDGTV